MRSVYDDGSYLQLNPSWHIEDSSWKARQIQRMLDRHRLPLRRVADIGCGAGEVLRLLAIDNPSVSFTGYEVSPQALDLARNRSGANVHFVLQDLLDAEEHFDLVLAIDVFEHVENYMGFLKKLRTKGEFKLFHVPLEITVHSVLRRRLLVNRDKVGHLHYFSVETVQATLEDCGYEVVDSFLTPAFRDFPSNTAKQRISNIAREVLHRMNSEFSTRLLGGSSMLVLAK